MIQNTVKKILVLLTAGVLLAGCSSSKEIATGSFSQSDCKEERSIDNSDEFVAETADNLIVFQKVDIVTLTVDVETYCNAQLAFDILKKDNEIYLKLKNNSGVKDKCVCKKSLSIDVKNVEPGDYTFYVTNLVGNQLLAKSKFTVN